MKKNTLTKEESKAAMETQMPIRHDASQQPPIVDENFHDTKAIARVSTFKQLAKIATSSRLAIGGNAQWIQPGKLFNPDYEGGLISPPFYITKAFAYVSKKGYGDRFGIEFVLSNGAMYMTSFPLKDGDITRNNLIAMFKEPGAPPVGPFEIVMLPTNKGNDYYSLVACESRKQTDEPEIPFVAIDEDIPF